ncbi:unnamed protein product [Pieris macdunnoughi]|uniref:Uncharacterized protein n=1 Tax=Pieris macdunnoughi TaxID=345717 RepID=A0A821XQP4_9NEOP|nr:unnamed protein product [Pieris macdunnoughi]
MAKPKKQKSEEELERRRVARREKYNRIKNNPELYATEQEKKRQNYLNRKESKQIKIINEMSPRDQRIQRRKWKESAKKYYKKKVSQKIIETVTVREVDSEDVQGNISADPLKEAVKEKESNPSNTELKLIKKIKTLKMQHRKQKQSCMLLVNRYKARIRVLQRQIFKLSRKTSNDIETTENKEKDKKQLFDELLNEQITQKFATTTSRKEKRAITNLIDGKKFKHFKVSTDLRKVCLRQRLKKKKMRV